MNMLIKTGFAAIVAAALAFRKEHGDTPPPGLEELGRAYCAAWAQWPAGTGGLT